MPFSWCFLNQSAAQHPLKSAAKITRVVSFGFDGLIHVSQLSHCECGRNQIKGQIGVVDLPLNMLDPDLKNFRMIEGQSNPGGFFEGTEPLGVAMLLLRARLGEVWRHKGTPGHRNDPHPRIATRSTKGLDLLEKYALGLETCLLV